MSLFKEEPMVTFDLSAVKKGDAIWAKHYSWDEGLVGFVTSLTESQLIAQYFPGISNVTNHFIIPATEYNEWEIRWSADLIEVNCYPEVQENESDAPADDDI